MGVDFHPTYQHRTQANKNNNGSETAPAYLKDVGGEALRSIENTQRNKWVNLHDPKTTLLYLVSLLF